MLQTQVSNDALGWLCSAWQGSGCRQELRSCQRSADLMNKVPGSFG